jgi:hypothetical protein
VRTVAALCVSRRSVYHAMHNVIAYDLDRDARTFPGGVRQWGGILRFAR